jgi:hypothetical protein
MCREPPGIADLNLFKGKVCIQTGDGRPQIESVLSGGKRIRMMTEVSLHNG